MGKANVIHNSDVAVISKTVSKTKKRSSIKRSCDVVLLNDDYTTMDFVVSILETIFGHSPAQATAIMLNVHKKGRGLAGSYSRDIAEAKVSKVHALAQAAGYPLKAIIEER
jgi:ATP-dependent Clp protease adaptor protein ClpS